MLEEKEKIREKENHRVFKQLLSTFLESEDVAQNETESISKNIRIVPKFFYDNFKKQLKVEFKIGNKRMYKIKDLSEFYDHIRNQEFYRYGEKLQLQLM